MSLLLTLAIGAGVALAVAYLIRIAIKWLKNKFVELIEKIRAKRMAYEDINRTIRECKSTITKDQLRDLANKGYSNVRYAVKEDGDLDIEIMSHLGNEEDVQRQLDENNGRIIYSV